MFNIASSSNLHRLFGEGQVRHPQVWVAGHEGSIPVRLRDPVIRRYPNHCRTEKVTLVKAI